MAITWCLTRKPRRKALSRAKAHRSYRPCWSYRMYKNFTDRGNRLSQPLFGSITGFLKAFEQGAKRRPTVRLGRFHMPIQVKQGTNFGFKLIGVEGKS